MVTFNIDIITSRKISYNNIEFKYLVDIPHSHCVFGSAKESNTGKTILFLVFNHLGKIYRHSGLTGTWVELHDADEYLKVRNHLLQALADKPVPCYTVAPKEYEKIWNNLGLVNELRTD